jgi:hypothetical protein
MMFYKFFCIFNRKAKISKKLIFDKPEVPMTVGSSLIGHEPIFKFSAVHFSGGFL